MNRRFYLVPIQDGNGNVIETAMIDHADKWLLNFTWRLTNGYAARKANGRTEYLHRNVMGIFGPGHSSVHIDHKDRNKLDCRRSNLREADAVLNQQNRGASKGSRFPRGVALDTRRNHYTARCTLEGRTYYLGSFSTPEQAGEAAARFRAEFMPFSPEAAA